MTPAPRLRIALLAGSFPKLSETFVLQQICCLLAQGHDVRIFAFDRPREAVLHPEIQRFGLLERTTYMKGPKHITTRLRALWMKLMGVPAQHFDAVVCHFGPIGEHGRALREMGMIDGKLAVFFHAYDLTVWFKKHPQDYYAKLLQEADLLLPISEHWRKLLLRMGASPDKLLVRHMGVDCAALRCSTRTLAAGEPLKLVTVARLIEKKGISYALAALALAEKQLPAPFEYHIVGDGPLLEQLKSEASAAGLSDRVRFHGALANTGVQSMLQSMHGFLAPSVTAADGDMEGIPVALMEAMAQGLPVISTRHSGIPELVRDGDTGWCVPERDAAALAAALVEWAHAPAGWADMARRARALVEAEFDAPTLAQRLVDDLPAPACCKRQTALGSAYPMKPRTVVCFSSQPWDDKMWTNKHHIMSRVAQQHRVVFVDFRQQSPVRFVKRARRDDAKTRVNLGNFWREAAVRRVPEGLEVLDVWTPWLNFVGSGHVLRRRSEFKHRVEVVKRWLAQQGITDAVLWVYHPGYGDHVASIPHSVILYDCVDEYSAFPEFRNCKEWIREQERRLCEAADVVACTAPALHERKQSLAPGRTHFVHNVGDAAHFGKAMDPNLAAPADISGLPRPVIGFIGAVSDYKLNLDWLIELADARPGYSVVLIGPVGIADPGTDVGKLKQKPNVHLLGHRGYETLPGYVKGFDVAVIPYRLNEYTQSVFPIKFFEMLASGRPVVISPLPAVEQYWGAARVADSAASFIAACDAAVNADTEQDKQARLELAAQNSWDSRVKKLLDLVEAALAKRAEATR